LARNWQLGRETGRSPGRPRRRSAPQTCAFRPFGGCKHRTLPARPPGHRGGNVGPKLAVRARNWPESRPAPATVGPADLCLQSLRGLQAQDPARATAGSPGGQCWPETGSYGAKLANELSHALCSACLSCIAQTRGPSPKRRGWKPSSPFATQTQRKQGPETDPVVRSQLFRKIPLQGPPFGSCSRASGLWPPGHQLPSSHKHIKYKFGGCQMGV